MGDSFGLEFQSSLAGLGKDLFDAAYPGLGSAKSSRTILGYFQAPLRGWDVRNLVGICRIAVHALHGFFHVFWRLEAHYHVDAPDHEHTFLTACSLQNLILSNVIVLVSICVESSWEIALGREVESAAPIVAAPTQVDNKPFCRRLDTAALRRSELSCWRRTALGHHLSVWRH